MEYKHFKFVKPFLIGLLFLSGCSLDLFGGGNSSLGNVGPDGQCIRDMQALASLLGQPKSCETSSGCPAGSYCSDQKVCAWECSSNSDCGQGVCSCDGRCQNADAGPQGPAVDPGCPRNVTLLTTEVKGKECRLDEDCAWGARCSTDTKTCQYDCLSDSECGTGFTCDCRGRCAQIGGEGKTYPESQLPVLSVSPTHHNIVLVDKSSAWAPRAVDIKVTAATAKVAEAFKPTVNVRADKTLYVTCDPTGRDSGFVAESCAIPFTFDASSAPHERTRRIWVRPREAATLVPTGGSVVPNGSFEQSDGGNGALGWTVASDVDGTWTRDTTVVKDGSSSVRFQVGPTADDGTWTILARRWVPIPTPGKYQVSYSYKSDQAAGSSAPNLDVWMWNNGVQTRAIRLFAPLGTNPWTRVVAPDPLVVEATTTRIDLEFITHKGTVWLDQVELVRLEPNANGYEGTGSLLVTSKDVANGEQLVTFGAAVPTPQPPQAFDGVYEGVLYVRGGGGGASAGLSPIAIPVTAWAKKVGTEDRLVFYDPTLSFSVTGQFYAPGMVYWHGELGDGYVARGFTSATTSAAISSFDENEGMLVGKVAFTPSVWPSLDTSPFAVDFRLRRRGDLIACSSSETCPNGYQCDQGGACVLGVDAGSGAMVETRHRLAEGWQEAAEHLFNLTEAAEGYTSPLATDFRDAYDISYDPFTIIGMDGIDISSSRLEKFGIGLCKNDLVNYGKLIESLGYPAVEINSGTEFLKAVPETCDKIYGDFTATVPAIKNTHVACLDRVLNDYYSRAIQLASATKKVPDCKRVYEIGEGGALANVVWPQSYQEYRDTKCVRSQRTLIVRPPSDPQSVIPEVWDNIYLCPVDALVTGKYRADVLAERALCFDETDQDGTRALRTSTLDWKSQSVMEYSGDHACKNGAIPGAVGLITMQDTAARNSNAVVPEKELLATCIKELQREPPVLTSLTNPKAQYQDFFQGRCFSPGKFYTAAAYAAGAPDTALGLTPRPRARKLYQRLIQQWLTLHMFVAERARQEHELADILNSANRSTPSEFNENVTPSVGREEILNQMKLAWQFMVTEQNTSALLSLEPSEIANPDYRTGITQAVSHHDQTVAVPVQLIEGLGSHFKILIDYLSSSAGTVFEQCRSGGASTEKSRVLERAGDALRYSFVIEGLAKLLRDKAGTVTWAARWDSALAELNALRGRVLSLEADIARCRNPLGIAEDDLPLFFGDPVGNSSRFFASSDYLLGTWARPAVESALATLSLARQAWLDQRNNKIQQKMYEFDAERRVEALKIEHGRTIVEGCGFTDVEAKDAIYALSDANSGINADNCFVRQADSSCTVKPEELFSKVSLDQARYQLCLYNKLNGKVTPPSELGTAVEQYVTIQMGAPGFIKVGPDVTVPVSALYKDPATGSNLRQKDLDNARDACANELGGTYEIPTALDVLPNPATPECYRGSLGEAMLALLAATKQMEVQISNWSDQQERYEVTVEKCFGIAGLISANDELITKYRAKMLELRKKREEKRKSGRFFKGGAMVVAGGLISLVPGGAAVGAPLAAAGAREIGDAVFDELTEMAGLSATSIANQMEDMERDFQAAMALHQNKVQLLSCTADAKQLWIGMTTAVLAIEAAGATARQQLVAMQNMKDRVRRAVTEGRAAVEREKGRTVPSVAHHYWLDEKITRFRKDFNWAKRLTYLAMRAVEFEFQQSLPLRQVILAATHPDQLHDAIRMLEQEQASRTINRRRPEESTLVLSLRDDILQIANRANTVPAGERNYTST
ncbi:MAG: hypothetical protein HY698_07725, partial [Deltaproteobacteria bacterium]|nr:hypothetical protein [Deltaproteobacteria bacterium]